MHIGGCHCCSNASEEGDDGDGSDDDDASDGGVVVASGMSGCRCCVVEGRGHAYASAQ